MRGEGSTVGAPREWAPSPIWPEGRDIFLLRPLLGARRAVLRQWLTARGASWIEDPANDDPRFARARARTESPAPSEGVPPEPCIAPLARACTAESWGLALARGRLREVSAAQAERFVAAACLCAAGTHRPPRHDRLANLTARLRGEPPVVSTLAGARVEADGDQVRLLREPGELARSRLEPTDLPAGAAAVWDGRFEIVSRRAGLTVQPLRGQAARLPAAARRALAMVPAGARGALPLITGNGVFDCPVLSPMQEVEVRALAYPRLLAASGAVTREP
jgi:tRNA(Ile)-lysidine synthase